MFDVMSRAEEAVDRARAVGRHSEERLRKLLGGPAAPDGGPPPAEDASPGVTP